MIEALSSENLPAPLFRYSALVKSGPFYKTAGMLGIDKNTGKLDSGGAGAQAAVILNNLVEALPDFNLSLDDMVSATIYTTRLDQFAEINAAWEAVFSADGHLPARTSVGVNALPMNAVVEMEFLFYKQDGGAR